MTPLRALRDMLFAMIFLVVFVASTLKMLELFVLLCDYFRWFR